MVSMDSMLPNSFTTGIKPVGSSGPRRPQPASGRWGAQFENIVYRHKTGGVSSPRFLRPPAGFMASNSLTTGIKPVGSPGPRRPQPASCRWGAKFENIARRTSRHSAAPVGLGPLGSKVWEHTTARRDNCGLVDGASGASRPCWIYVGTRSTSPWASFLPAPCPSQSRDCRLLPSTSAQGV